VIEELRKPINYWILFFYLHLIADAMINNDEADIVASFCAV
jgi:hypothetical protein